MNAKSIPLIRDQAVIRIPYRRLALSIAFAHFAGKLKFANCAGVAVFKQQMLAIL